MTLVSKKRSHSASEISKNGLGAVDADVVDENVHLGNRLCNDLSPCGGREIGDNSLHVSIGHFLTDGGDSFVHSLLGSAVDGYVYALLGQ